MSCSNNRPDYRERKPQGFFFREQAHHCDLLCGLNSGHCVSLLGCLAWYKVVSSDTTPTFFLTKVMHSPEKSCKSTAAVVSPMTWQFQSLQRNGFWWKQKCPLSTCGVWQWEVLRALPVTVPGLQGKEPPGCIFKSETGQNIVTAAGCRYQTLDCTQEKKETLVASKSVGW